jgi:pimeloyl-ACP methyl ester carboxylesterase
LVIAAERDFLTPPQAARKMAALIQEAAYHEVPRGTHFAMLEQADLINGWIKKFIENIEPPRTQETAEVFL